MKPLFDVCDTFGKTVEDDIIRIVSTTKIEIGDILEA